MILSFSKASVTIDYFTVRQLSTCNLPSHRPPHIHIFSDYVLGNTALSFYLTSLPNLTLLIVIVVYVTR